jgi:hypothetical protein
MASWQTITGGISLPPRSDDSTYGAWSHILAIVDDTTAQLAILLSYASSDQKIIKDLNDDSNHMAVVYYVINQSLKSDLARRAAVQNILSKIIKELYASTIKLPTQWGHGHRLWRPSIGLI